MSQRIDLAPDPQSPAAVISTLSSDRTVSHHAHSPRRIDTVTELFADAREGHCFRTALVDVWGVLTDGRTAFPHAAGALKDLRVKGVQVVLVSNTSRRAEDLGALLRTQGIPETAYDAIITGGELAFQRLKSGTLPEAPGANRCLVIGTQPGGHWAKEAGLTCVDTVGAADLLLGVGVLGAIADETRSPESAVGPELMKTLESAAACGRVLVLTNADQSVRIGTDRYAGIGVLARIYSELGGRAVIYGKPQKDIYASALALAGQVDVKSAVMVGDTLATDIAGAQAVGITTVLVSGAGSHAKLLHPEGGDGMCGQALASLLDETGTTPDYVTEALR